MVSNGKRHPPTCLDSCFRRNDRLVAYTCHDATWRSGGPNRGPTWHDKRAKVYPIRPLVARSTRARQGHAFPEGLEYDVGLNQSTRARQGHAFPEGLEYDVGLNQSTRARQGHAFPQPPLRPLVARGARGMHARSVLSGNPGGAPGACMPSPSGIPINPVSGSSGFPLAQLLPLAGQGTHAPGPLVARGARPAPGFDQGGMLDQGESEGISIRGKSRDALGHATTRWRAINTAGQ